MFDDPADNTVKVFKGWFGFRKYYKALRHCEQAYPDSTFVLHMRIGTSGKRDAANCHPFLIRDDAGFAHNGVMFGLGDKERSDTREFAEDTLSKLPTKFWDNEDIIQALDKCATASGSKYTLLVGDGSYFIFNDGAGHWHNGVWFSNYSYRVVSKPPAPPTSKIVKPADSTVAESVCVCCQTSVKPDDIVFSHLSARICRACMDAMLGIMQIPCETCNMNNTLTEELLRGEEIHCKFCHTIFQQDDMAWHLLSTFKE